MLGNMAKRAELHLINVVSQGDWLSAEAVKREAARLRERLSRPGQSPLEELAVARWVQAWIQLEFVESKCHRAEVEGERARSGCGDNNSATASWGKPKGRCS